MLDFEDVGARQLLLGGLDFLNRLLCVCVFTLHKTMKILCVCDTKVRPKKTGSVINLAGMVNFFE